MNRRKFLQQIIYSSATTAFIVRTASAEALFVKEKISGRIMVDNKPLPGALISDGFDIVVSDKKGYYSIEPNDKADFVFMISPSGYKFPEESGLVRYYKEVESSSNYDFNLTRLDKSDKKHQFIIWADPQLTFEEDIEKFHSQTVPDVQKLVENLGENTLLQGIVVGDMVGDRHDFIPAYNDGIKKTGISFFHAIGNHDMDYNKGGDETSDTTFKSYYGPNYYSFNRGKAHYVILDDVRYLGTGKKYDGHISEEQLAWLEKDLSFVDKDDLVIICLHIPVYSSVKNSEALYKILAPYKNVHIMSGHTHTNKNVIKNGIYEHVHGTVCGGWWRGPICGDGTPKGYGVYEVNGTDLTWYYKSTGFDKSEQLRVYVDDLTNQKRIIANVWNADPEWRIECWIDRKFLGLMENVKGLDPLAVEQSNAVLEPGQKRRPKPRSSDHLFIAHAPISAGRIKVIAIDRFENKYQKEINS